MYNFLKQLLDDVITVVKEYEIIIKIEKKDIINITYRQRVAFKKFNKFDKFMEKIKDIGVSRSTMYFKINFIKILENI